jgi:hypothetical protein
MVKKECRHKIANYKEELEESGRFKQKKKKMDVPKSTLCCAHGEKVHLHYKGAREPGSQLRQMDLMGCTKKRTLSRWMLATTSPKLIL